MSRRAVPEAVGLSVLDLVCGLFGLLVVLFATTERVNGRPGVSALPLKFVRVQLDTNYSAQVGLEIKLAGEEPYRSWPNCADAGPVTWASCRSGIVEALIESSAPIESIRFLLLEPPSSGSEMRFVDVDLWVTTPDDGRMCRLGIATTYRGDLAEASQCRRP